MPTREGTAQDHTGEVFNALPRNERNARAIYQSLKLMKNPSQFRCPECNGERWYVIADDSDTCLVTFQCSNDRCRAMCSPMEMHKPQMDDNLAKRAGLYVPSNMSVLDIGDNPDKEGWGS